MKLPLSLAFVFELVLELFLLLVLVLELILELFLPLELVPEILVALGLVQELVLTWTLNSGAGARASAAAGSSSELGVASNSAISLELVLALDEPCLSFLLCTVGGYGVRLPRDGYVAIVCVQAHADDAALPTCWL